MLSGDSSPARTSARKRAGSAPYRIRWSALTVSVIIVRSTISPPTRASTLRAAPTPRVALLAMLVVGGLVAPGARAMTRVQATRVALRVLQASRAGGAVLVFGLPRPLRKGSDVVEAGPGVFSGHHVAFTGMR